MRGMRGRRLGLAVLALGLLIGAEYLLRAHPSDAANAADVSASAAELPASPREIPVGMRLPSLVLADDRGERVALGSLRGAPTVLLFFRATSCPLCRTQLAAFSKLAARFHAAGVQVVAASPDMPAALAKLRRELELPIRLLSDGDEQAVNALCGGLAHCELIVDEKGVVRWGAFSESWSHPPEPEALLQAARQQSQPL
jgi:peroxiredoxin